MSIREDKKSIPIKPFGPGKILHVDFIPQDLTNWCWAACVAMVLQFYKIEFGKQCQLAAAGLGASATTCCTDVTRPDCDCPLSDDEITCLWHARKIPASYEPNRIPDLDLFREIDCEERPVEIGYGPGPGQDGVGHVVIVYGWQGEFGQLSFLSHDPQNRAQTAMALFALPGRSGNRVWDATWRNLDKPTP